MSTQSIDFNKLVCIETMQHPFPLLVKLAYASADNALFNEQIYKDDAKLWLHQDLADIVLQAAKDAYHNHGLSMVLFDGLRPVEAQAAMLKTRRAQENPEWLEAPAMLSSPGGGAHPRGMAIDLSLLDEHGDEYDMGTAFDYMSHQSDAQHNPAHREHKNHSPDILNRRGLLTKIMTDAAQATSQQIYPLPQEWWDYRLPTDIVQRYAPICDADLPPHMKMMPD